MWKVYEHLILNLISLNFFLFWGLSKMWPKEVAGCSSIWTPDFCAWEGSFDQFFSRGSDGSFFFHRKMGTRNIDKTMYCSLGDHFTSCRVRHLLDCPSKKSKFGIFILFAMPQN